jgi:hypothetical protein
MIVGLSLLATLACDFSEIGQTITATPNLTPAAVFTVTASAPLASPTASTTPFPSATLDPNATAAAVNTCTLVTKDEAASAIGEPVQDPIPAGGGCIYVDSGAGKYVMSFYALPSINTPEMITGRAYILMSYGVQIPSADLTNLQALGKQGDAKGVVEGLLTLTKNPNGFSAEPVENLGDGAIWVSKVLGVYRQGYLLAARGDALVGLDILVTSARDEASVRDAASLVIKQMLVRLPPRFLVSFPTLVPSVTPTLRVSLTPSLSSTHQTTTTSPQTRTPTAGASQSPVPTLVQTQTPVVTPTLKPPAFSVPIVSNDQVTYGGDCGLSLATITVTVADPSQVSPIAKVDVFVRINDPISGRTTDWKALPMRSDTHNLWLHTLNAETELAGHEQFANGFIEYYFSATNAAGITAESPHYGVISSPLTLSACATATPTPL